MNEGTRFGGVVAWFVHNPIAANILIVLIIAIGFTTAVGLRREGFPTIAPDQITIDVEFPSGSPALSEEGIVVKIEEALLGTPGIKKVSSTARIDGATVTIEKTTGHELNELLAEIKTRVDAIPNLPLRAERPVIRKQTWEEHVIWIQVYGNVERLVLEQVARALRQELLRQPSIRRVDLAGERNPEIHIEIEEGRLLEYGLGLGDVSAAIANESLTELAGQLRSADGTISLKADRQGYWRRDFAEIPLLTRADGGSLLLGDIASLVEGYADSPQVWMRYQGLPAIGLQVLTDHDSDIDAMLRDVENVLQRWRVNAQLPAGVELVTWNDRSKQVTDRIALLVRHGLTGAVFVFVILALTLGTRAGFWVTMGLPISFAGAFAFMGSRFLDLSMNELTTFGMIVALGIVVDDAVVVAESVSATKEREGESHESTIRGVFAVALPTIFGVLTTVAAFSALALVEGEMGQLFAQFAVVVAICLLFSLLESMLILPSHLRHLDLRKKQAASSGTWAALNAIVARGFTQLLLWYASFLRTVLAFRYVALLLMCALGVSGAALLTHGVVRSVFFPDIPTDVVTATLKMETSAGYGLTERNLNRLELALRQSAARLEAKHSQSALLSAVQTSLTGDLTGQVTAELRARDVRGVTADELVEAWRVAAGGLEGSESVTFVSSFEGVEPIELELATVSDAELRAAHTELRATLASIPGVRDIRDNLDPGRSEIGLTLTKEGRARGLTAEHLAGQVQQAFFGYEVQRVQRGKDEIKVRVRYPGLSRSDVGDLAKARIRTPAGVAVPLDVVATTELSSAVSEISHVNGERVGTITAAVDKDITSPETVLGILEDLVLPGLREKYPGVQIRQAGEAEELTETSTSLKHVSLSALALIYALLAIPLRSYTQPLLIMAVIPFGVLGAIVGHWIHSLPMSIMSLFGMLAVSGVVVNDSLLLLATFNQRRNNGEDVVEALIGAGTGRLRAILLTSVTTFGSLLPLVWETSEQAQYLVPAAISLAYGVLLATGITLVLVPTLHAVGADVGSLVRWRQNDRDSARELRV